MELEGKIMLFVNHLGVYVHSEHILGSAGGIIYWPKNISQHGKPRAFQIRKKIIINTSPDYIAHIFNLWSTVGGEDWNYSGD